MLSRFKKTYSTTLYQGKFGSFKHHSVEQDQTDREFYFICSAPNLESMQTLDIRFVSQNKYNKKKKWIKHVTTKIPNMLDKLSKRLDR